MVRRGVLTRRVDHTSRYATRDHGVLLHADESTRTASDAAVGVGLPSESVRGEIDATLLIVGAAVTEAVRFAGDRKSTTMAITTVTYSYDISNTELAG